MGQLQKRSIGDSVNIFYLDECPRTSAMLHCDKHVVKMIVEYAQLLSTAHRVLDGELYIDDSSGRKIKRWRHPDVSFENNLYKASFVNHPSAVWVRESAWNYHWLEHLWHHLCSEYNHRYNKDHATYIKLAKYLQVIPQKLPLNIDKTEVPQCMPDDVKGKDPVAAYRDYYRKYKKGFAKWTDRQVPSFMEKTIISKTPITELNEFFTL
tara:strand:- start:156 stop:782 length:627 start_codon:yes stop_codon:yes gene_type:complete